MTKWKWSIYCYSQQSADRSHFKNLGKTFIKCETKKLWYNVVVAVLGVSVISSSSLHKHIPYTSIRVTYSTLAFSQQTGSDIYTSQLWGLYRQRSPREHKAKLKILQSEQPDSFLWDSLRHIWQVRGFALALPQILDACDETFHPELWAKQHYHSTVFEHSRSDRGG